jgi:hypothetical protein
LTPTKTRVEVEHNEFRARLLRIEVVDDEIVTVSEFLAKAWKLANDKARALGWIRRGQKPKNNFDL